MAICAIKHFGYGGLNTSFWLLSRILILKRIHFILFRVCLDEGLS